MPSSIIDSEYFKDMFGTQEMRNIFSEENMVESWIKTEGALAAAQEKLGVIPNGIADKIKATSIKDFSMKEMKSEFDRVGFPILPFVHQLNASLDSESARWVHYGATTQDILDTGTVLQIKEGLEYIESEILHIRNALSTLVSDHRNTAMSGRTFQQLAAPISFGYKVAVWLNEIDRHLDRLKELRERILVGQCAGAVGTFATLKDRGMDVQKEMMNILELHQPDITWHTARDRWAELIFWQGLVTSTLGKIANEIGILMRSEIGEVSEPFEKGRGASTTLPQKRNPISCEPIIAIAAKMRGLVENQLSVMIQEHERPIGPMHLEWMIIPEAFVLMSGSLKHSRYVLENLVVDKDKMLENLGLNGGLIMAEAVMMGLAPKIGKKKAHDIIYEAAGFANDQGISLEDALKNDETITSLLSEQEIKDLINPLNYLGSVEEMIDQVLTKRNKSNRNEKMG